MELRMGVVEDNVDPMKLGRLRVRVFGLHSEDRTEYPTADLPWAVMLHQLSAVSGQGEFFVPNNGDWVAVSFFDPEMQRPVVLGVMSRFVESLPDFASGFSDPNSVNPSSDFVGESGVPRVARNENIADTIIQDKKDNRTAGVQCVGESWDEPETPYAAEYPNNRVIHTRHHVIELDDTNGVERVHVYHKSGTSVEMHPNGDQVELIKAKRFVVVSSDNDVLVQGKYNTRIELDSNKQIEGDENKKVAGDVSTDITGDRIVAVGQDSTETVGQNKKVDATGSAEYKSGTSSKMDAGTSAEVKGGTTAKLDAGTSATVNAGTTITISAGGAVNISASGAVTITGSTISLN